MSSTSALALLRRNAFVVVDWEYWESALYVGIRRRMHLLEPLRWIGQHPSTCSGFTAMTPPGVMWGANEASLVWQTCYEAILKSFTSFRFVVMIQLLPFISSLTETLQNRPGVVLCLVLLPLVVDYGWMLYVRWRMVSRSGGHHTITSWVDLTAYSLQDQCHGP